MEMIEAAEIDVLLVALYVAQWNDKDMAEWAKRYIEDHRHQCRIHFGPLKIVRLPHRMWALYDSEVLEGVSDATVPTSS